MGGGEVGGSSVRVQVLGEDGLLFLFFPRGRGCFSFGVHIRGVGRLLTWDKQGT